MLERTVTPFRLCQCGCGAPVHGKARLDSPACRKRVQRQRDAKKAGSPKQFNLVLQSEIPVTIPTVPRPAVPPSVQVPSGSDDVPRRSPPTIPVVHHDWQRRKSFVWQGQPEPDIDFKRLAVTEYERAQLKATAENFSSYAVGPVDVISEKDVPAGTSGTQERTGFTDLELAHKFCLEQISKALARGEILLGDVREHWADKLEKKKAKFSGLSRIVFWYATPCVEKLMREKWPVSSTVCPSVCLDQLPDPKYYTAKQSAVLLATRPPPIAKANEPELF